MSYILREQLAAAENHGGSRSASEIQYLILHYTGNDGDTAANNAVYFKNNIVKASAHYFVDDTYVYRSVPDLTIAWSVGGTRYADIRTTGGGTMYGIITNRNSLSVELCGTLGDGSRRPSETTLKNAAALCRKLMDRYQIPLSRVYRHFDVTGKHCPAYWMDEAAWQTFKARLKSSSPHTQNDCFQQLMGHWLAEHGSLPPSPASEEARLWAESYGIITGFPDGSKQYKAFCTREQLVIMLYRLWKLLKKPPE